jgi:hypothetical protein
MMCGTTGWNSSPCPISSPVYPLDIPMHHQDPTHTRSNSKRIESWRTSGYHILSQSPIPPAPYTARILHMSAPSEGTAPSHVHKHHMHTTTLRGRMVLIQSECTSHSIFLSMFHIRILSHSFPLKQGAEVPCRKTPLSRFPSFAYHVVRVDAHSFRKNSVTE